MSSPTTTTTIQPATTCQKSQGLTSVDAATITKTEYIGFDGRLIISPADENGKPIRIHKIITTTITTVTFAEDGSRSPEQNPKADEAVPEPLKEIDEDGWDTIRHTAVGVQQAVESATGYVRRQMSSIDESKLKSSENDQNSLLYQASVLKDAFFKTAITAKDATMNVLKDLTIPSPYTESVESNYTTTGFAEPDAPKENIAQLNCLL